MSADGKRQRHKVQLGLEVLEDRCVPAVSITQSGTTLTIVDTGPGSDTITITDLGGDPDNVVKVQVNNRSQPYRFRRVNQFQIKLNSGNNNLTYDLNNVTAKTSRTVNATLGGGNDDFQVHLMDDSISARCNISINITGGAGNDTIGVSSVDSSFAAGATLNVNLDGGDGFDLIGLCLNANLAGNVNAILGGGSGNDSVFACCVLGSTGNGSLTLTQTGGGSGSDTVTTFVGAPPGNGNIVNRILQDSPAGTGTLFYQPTIPNVRGQQLSVTGFATRLPITTDPCPPAAGC